MLESICEFLKKVKDNLPLNQIFHSWGSTQEMKRYVHTKPSTRLLIAALFLRAQNWEQRECLWTRECTHKVWQTHSGNRSAIRSTDDQQSCEMGDPQKHDPQWKKLRAKIAIFRHAKSVYVTHTYPDWIPILYTHRYMYTHCMIPFIWKFRKGEFVEPEKFVEPENCRPVVVWGWECRMTAKWLAGIFFWGDGNF